MTRPLVNPARAGGGGAYACRFARPDWMVISVLAVSPPHVRPAVISDGGARGEDDITFKLGDILKV